MTSYLVSWYHLQLIYLINIAEYETMWSNAERLHDNMVFLHTVTSCRCNSSSVVPCAVWCLQECPVVELSTEELLRCSTCQMRTTWTNSMWVNLIMFLVTPVTILITVLIDVLIIILIIIFPSRSLCLCVKTSPTRHCWISWRRKVFRRSGVFSVTTSTSSNQVCFPGCNRVTQSLIMMRTCSE